MSKKKELAYVEAKGPRSGFSEVKKHGGCYGEAEVVFWVVKNSMQIFGQVTRASARSRKPVSGVSTLTGEIKIGDTNTNFSAHPLILHSSSKYPRKHIKIVTLDYI
ncbi:hypothetical protein TIFTF001_049597 [Ficus carica]|uniref:Uncharacterized protein n=1 Tax=Ficus carica TaxID=3494 RepID=A0AA87ZC78_FICCA|nr:hypothetical protein TIFTF001_049590 [Ficus carica]GMN30199.1 hypothetical protein TIFTF001_049593 [Ficus carica]GMN30215.1 hypothetical protein TIFTF001_049594 [Ficus carica]GMN30231.1 hypothetical protein TIFTF001_049597 [Ficus carica]